MQNRERPLALPTAVSSRVGLIAPLVREGSQRREKGGAAGGQTVRDAFGHSCEFSPRLSPIPVGTERCPSCPPAGVSGDRGLPARAPQEAVPFWFIPGPPWGGFHTRVGGGGARGDRRAAALSPLAGGATENSPSRWGAAWKLTPGPCPLVCNVAGVKGAGKQPRQDIFPQTKKTRREKRKKTNVQQTLCFQVLMLIPTQPARGVELIWGELSMGPQSLDSQ